MHDTADTPYVEEDEINLLDLLLVLLKHKLMIIGIVFVTGAAAVVISLYLTNIYRSEATLVIKTQEKDCGNPLAALGGFGGAMIEDLGLGVGGGSIEKLEVVLKSRNLTNRVITKYNLMPVLFSDIWDEGKNAWNTKRPPTVQDGYEVMQGRLQIKPDIKKNAIGVALDHEKPETAKKIVDYYLTELSEVLREEVLQDAKENMRFFKKQLEATTDTLLSEKIYAMLAKEIEKETFARAQKYYSFEVLDPPIAPDLDKKVRPRRALICILSVIVAFFISVFLAFAKEYVHRLRTDDPEGYEKVAQGLKFGKKVSKS